MIKAGQGVFGAKVSIAQVRVQLMKSRLTVRRLQVADKASPMQNLFQFEEAAFDFRALPLLEKKAIIDEASLTGLKFGTPRQSSGALPLEDKRPGFVGKAVSRLQDQVETVTLAKLDDAKKYYDPKTIVNPNQLETFKVVDSAKTEIQKAPQVLQKKCSFCIELNRYWTSSDLPSVIRNAAGFTTAAQKRLRLQIVQLQRYVGWVKSMSASNRTAPQ